MTILPPCPYEGCTSDSDHHWHLGSSEPMPCGIITLLLLPAVEDHPPARHLWLAGTREPDPQEEA